MVRFISKVENKKYKNGKTKLTGTGTPSKYLPPSVVPVTLYRANLKTPAATYRTKIILTHHKSPIIE